MQMRIWFAGMPALSPSKTITDIQKSVDKVLVVRTNQSILLCNDTVFCFILSGALEAVQWNKIQMRKSDPPHLQHDQLTSCMTFRLKLQKGHSALELEM